MRRRFAGSPASASSGWCRWSTPAAHHSRFEHSLGVYRLALLLLRRLATDASFAQLVDRERADLFIAAALLHDVGHWPFAHPIEDVRLADVPRHEQMARQFITEGEIAAALREDWATSPEEVARLLGEGGWDESTRVLATMLSGPLDVDKLDYLARDSLHAGVPYGRNFDQNRLIGALCLDSGGDGLAITTKGKTAAEMMVFARYVMFSEVYWHHSVRAATAMFQRAFFETRANLDLDATFLLDEPSMIGALRDAASGGAAELFDGLFGPRRQVYKRLAEYSFLESPDVYRRLAGRPFEELIDVGGRLADRFSQLQGAHDSRPSRAYRRTAAGAGGRISRERRRPANGRRPAAQRRFAGRAHARSRTIRRLRQEGPRVCRRRFGGRTAAACERGRRTVRVARRIARLTIGRARPARCRRRCCPPVRPAGR